MHSMETKRKIERVIVHVVLIFFSIIMLVPFIWMLLTAFKSVSEATQIDPFVQSQKTRDRTDIQGTLPSEAPCSTDPLPCRSGRIPGARRLLW